MLALKNDVLPYKRPRRNRFRFCSCESRQVGTGLKLRASQPYTKGLKTPGLGPPGPELLATSPTTMALGPENN